jgi:hypothetical protein
MFNIYKINEKIKVIVGNSYRNIDKFTVMAAFDNRFNFRREKEFLSVVLTQFHPYISPYNYNTSLAGFQLLSKNSLTLSFGLYASKAFFFAFMYTADSHH